MSKPDYPSQLYKKQIKTSVPSLEASELREDRIQDSIETTYDPNDMPLEIKKNLEANLGPIDTEGEIKAHGLDKKLEEEDPYESPHP
ncbi:hypothetical protein [Legionella quateirensis]|uniref:Uncharacterized protein n=1 Tax=Legionella quateirensis TaxID=45072 RepID=A0A378KPZ2_9GAMM|nr:hypothetical protein [Legionella quateirensis]KTD54784.1 hypothetical protein Lqua_0291 [Legionella quateirensis]STY16964.1 Uncharacterised protein [Legionella quateirensis]